MLRQLKRIATVSILLLALWTGPLLAGPIGNPSAQMPPRMLALGPLFDLYSQDFTANGFRITGSGDRLMLNVRYGVDRNIELISNVGFSRESLKDGGGEYHGNYGMGVELAAKMTLAELKRNHTKFGGGAKLLLARSSVDLNPTQSFDATWTEFGFFGGFSLETQADMIPYLGFQFAKTNTQLKNFPGALSDFDEENRVGGPYPFAKRRPFSRRLFVAVLVVDRQLADLDDRELHARG